MVGVVGSNPAAPTSSYAVTTLISSRGSAVPSPAAPLRPSAGMTSVTSVRGPAVRPGAARVRRLTMKFRKRQPLTYPLHINEADANMDGVLLILALLFGGIALWGAMGMLQVNRKKNEFDGGGEIKSAGPRALW